MKTIDLSAQEIAVRPIVETADIRGAHRMLGIKEVCYLVPYSKRHIDRLVAKGMFPAPIFLSENRRAWRASAVIQFLRDREAAGQHKRNYSTKKRSMENIEKAA